MKTIKCNRCDDIIYVEYESLNIKVNKIITEVNNQQTNDCAISIYLTCKNNHTGKYFCKIEKNDNRGG